MPYQIAGIDVHKKMLAVVVADVEVEGDYHFERLKVGTSPAQLRALADWLVEREVEEVVMESTAQSWRPVWEALEQYWRPLRRTRAGASPVSGTLHLAQAQSNRGAGGRKRDFPDAERLVKRLVAQELTLSFVPDAEQRLWRTVMRRKYQITRNRVQHQALAMKVPADLYARSPRVYRGLEDLSYPFHDATFMVTHCGRICFHGRKINLSHVFAGQHVGVTQVGERIWLVTFMHYDLGYFDDEVGRLEPIANPFGPKVLPMCSE